MENTQPSIEPTNQDDRIMAALSHGAILLPMTGIIVPIIIWVTQKDKSRYIAFQSLQALAFHSILFVTWFFGMACYVLSFFSMFAAMPDDAFAPIISFAVLGGVFCGGAFFVLYGLVGVIMTLQGKDFRYLLLGDFIRRRME